MSRRVIGFAESRLPSGNSGDAGDSVRVKVEVGIVLIDEALSGKCLGNMVEHTLSVTTFFFFLIW